MISASGGRRLLCFATALFLVGCHSEPTGADDPPFTVQVLHTSGHRIYVERESDLRYFLEVSERTVIRLRTAQGERGATLNDIEAGDVLEARHGTLRRSGIPVALANHIVIVRE